MIRHVLIVLIGLSMGRAGRVDHRRIQRRDRHQHVGDVDALVVGDFPADLDFRDDRPFIDFDRLQSDLAVVNQDAIAGAERILPATNARLAASDEVNPVPARNVTPSITRSRS